MSALRIASWQELGWSFGESPLVHLRKNGRQAEATVSCSQALPRGAKAVFELRPQWHAGAVSVAVSKRWHGESASHNQPVKRTRTGFLRPALAQVTRRAGARRLPLR